MIPLYWILVGWLVAVLIFCLLAIMTFVVQMRFGIRSRMMFASGALFLGVSAVVLMTTLAYIGSVSWDQPIEYANYFLPHDFTS